MDDIESKEMQDLVTGDVIMWNLALYMVIDSDPRTIYTIRAGTNKSRDFVITPGFEMPLATVEKFDDFPRVEERA